MNFAYPKCVKNGNRANDTHLILLKLWNKMELRKLKIANLLFFSNWVKNQW